tara:strand:- start:833 stop:1039 length:207 start_codon:yes stop_codon:yes gene_type:complete
MLPSQPAQTLEVMKMELAEIVGVRPEDIIITQKADGSIDVKVGKSSGPTTVYTVSEGADVSEETNDDE